MRLIDADALNSILLKHSLWTRSVIGGEKADLREADLREANLYEADLYRADLREANLYRANLCRTNLFGADLREANLYRANLYGASLYGADLRGANLCEANLYRTDLHETDLRGASLYVPLACPDSGEFTGWKKANKYIVKLTIPADAQRLSATTEKCRCDKAYVAEIQNIDGSLADISEVSSDYEDSFIYTVGKNVCVSNFCTDRWQECSAGIHFFINREDAVRY